MDPSAWLQKAFDELVELGSGAERDPSDAWRSVALMARLLGSASGPKPPDEMMQRLPALLAVAGEPDIQMLLGRLADELDAGDDAWGPLLDALLDLDDAIGLLHLSGQSAAELEVARRVAGLVSLHPERVLSLGAFAEMRLATVHDDAAVHRIWSAVEGAPAEVLAAALPEQAPDEVAQLARSRPWLEAACRRVQLSATALAQVAAGISAYVPLNLAASLGESSPISVELSWGEVRRLGISLKTTVELRAPATCQLWHSTPDRSALLSTTAWQLEPGESPVLITATESTDAKTLEEALARGCRAAGLVLIEAEHQ